MQFVRKIGARVILRGLRTLSDMEYEFGMTLTNHRLDPEVETVFLMADGEYSHVSSTLVKQVAYFGGTEALKRFVPEELVGPILSKVAPGRQCRDLRGLKQVAGPLPHSQTARLSSLVKRAHALYGAVEVGVGEPAAKPVVLVRAIAS